MMCKIKYFAAGMLLVLAYEFVGSILMRLDRLEGVVEAMWSAVQH